MAVASEFGVSIDDTDVGEDDFCFIFRESTNE